MTFPYWKLFAMVSKEEYNQFSEEATRCMFTMFTIELIQTTCIVEKDENSSPRVPVSEA